MPSNVGRFANTKVALLVRRRVTDADGSFAEDVVWALPTPLAPSMPVFKYRLAYVVNGHCVVRYDNEAGKRDHRHVGQKQTQYAFSNPQQLIADFEKDIARWKNENGDS